MLFVHTRTTTLASFVTVLVAISSNAVAQKKYGPGATDTEIKIGNTMPYSGPGSPYGIVGKVEAAYFKKINDEGGINGRKINFISYDDAYTPTKAVEQTRKLIESDDVLFIFGSVGTASNAAVQKYMNTKQVPQLFVATGASKFNNPKEFPWTMGWQPDYPSEAQVYAKYLLREKPDAKIAVFYQSGDYGKDYLNGLKDGLGAKAASMIVSEESYDPTEPTIDTHILKMKASGADVLVDITSPKFTVQTIRKLTEIGWKPLHILNNVSTSVDSVMRVAGIENSQGIISATFTKDPTDPQWKDDQGVKAYDEFLLKYFPEGNRSDSSVFITFGYAQTVVQVLKQCGDDLTRDNVMRQAANLKGFELTTLLPGIMINTAPDDYAPVKDLRMMRLEGERWQLFGNLISGSSRK